jgi:DNA primase
VAAITRLCPFHGEKLLFTVSEELQILNGFGCGKAGDILPFGGYERNTFPEHNQLAAMAGITLKKGIVDKQNPVKSFNDLNSQSKILTNICLLPSIG